MGATWTRGQATSCSPAMYSCVLMSTPHCTVYTMCLQLSMSLYCCWRQTPCAYMLFSPFYSCVCWHVSREESVCRLHTVCTHSTTNCTCKVVTSTPGPADTSPGPGLLARPTSCPQHSNMNAHWERSATILTSPRPTRREASRLQYTGHVYEQGPGPELQISLSNSSGPCKMPHQKDVQSCSIHRGGLSKANQLVLSRGRL